ncbi:MAG: hypothetical protein IT369_11155 [Candidatus Latescibacteria bacterium]|nr:hypothetical protein [Candidatus Latescibacterota bacterium]
MCPQSTDPRSTPQAGKQEFLRQCANLRHLRQRIATLAYGGPLVEIREQINGVEIVQDVALRRTRLYFTEVPTTVVRQYLKAHGFHWSQYEGCWQRLLSLHALALARKAAELAGVAGTEE